VIKPSEKFERQIARIHKLIEQPESEVTWNDRIPDPDNTEQPRQIDITIRRHGKLTMIECRIHNKKQDVKWIEELIGRRLSLKADVAIAVSASGFTSGAIAKAKAHGIILRDILSLTKEEITQWGRKTKVNLTFYEYSDISLVMIFDAKNRGQVSTADIIEFLKKHSDVVYMIFENVAQLIDERNPQGLPGTFSAELMHNNLRVNGKLVQKSELKAHVRTIKRDVEIPSVVVYDAVDVGALERNVFIEAVDLGNFEITQSSNTVIVVLDLMPVQAPPNCQFRFVTIDFGRVVTIKNTEILGIPKLGISLQQMKVGISFR
jgi:hypothetical protein